MKRILPVLFVLGLVSAFVWTMFFLYKKSQAKPQVFTTEQAFITDIVKKSIATGKISPKKEIAIKSRISGIVESLVVKPSDKVKAGQLIAKIRLVPNAVAVNSAEARKQQARVRLENAKKELARFQALYTQKLVSETDLTNRQLTFELAQQEFAAAGKNLVLIREGAARSSGKVANEVYSTIDGMVLEVPVEEGDSVIESNTFNAGTTVASVADMNNLIFKGRVDESEVDKMKQGMPLNIRVGAIKDTIFAAELVFIAPKGNEVEGTVQFPIEAHLKTHQEHFIRANYSANADIVLDQRKQVLAVREAVVQFDKGKPFVEVEIANQKFVRRDLELGISDGINIQVLRGIALNERIKQPK